MGLDAWLTLAVVGLLLYGMMRNLAPPDLMFLGATALLAVRGIITPQEALAGFSNSAVITVALLFVIAAALRETGVLDYVGQRVLGSARTPKSVLGRLALLCLPLSAFLNNTPIVAMLMPIVIEWCRRRQVAPSRLLIPLSYLTILGGTCTLIGTSTNLVVNGLMIENDIPPMSLFEIARVGIPYSVVGVGYLMLFGNKLLPERKELIEQLGESRREYIVEMLVDPACRLVGQTIEAAGLRHLPGLFLIEIDRDGETIGPVGPEETVHGGDRLIFTGVVGGIVELEKIPGLIPAADSAYLVTPQEQRRRKLCEAVISNTSPLIGRTIREADFRSSYGAAVIAVHRSGSRVAKKVGDIRLQHGDTLLLQTDRHFLRMHRNDPAFHLVSNVEGWRPLRRDRAWAASACFLLLLVLMTTGYVEISIAAMFVAVLMIGLRCISTADARQSVEWPVLVTIAASFGVGAALQNSGAAAAIAGFVVNATHAWGPLAALAVFYLLGSLITEVITNNAAAVLLFPFCLETARLFQVSERPFLMALALSASASFMTPIGYQTNMMVYGPGGYRFSDYVRIGAPLNFLLWIVAVLLIPVFWPFAL